MLLTLFPRQRADAIEQPIEVRRESVDLTILSISDNDDDTLYMPILRLLPSATRPAQRRTGQALVKDRRLVLNLEAGDNIVRFTDVAATIDPTSVRFASTTDPTGTTVVEQSFEYDLATAGALLKRYLDREITVDQQRGQGVETVTGTLVGAQGSLILKQSDGSVRIVPQNSSVKLPSLPGGLISKPTLVWDIESASAGAQKARFTYQTGGMTWWTDYNLTYSEPRGSCRLDVGAWVTIVNQSGASYADAKLKLIAGEPKMSCQSLMLSMPATKLSVVRSLPPFFSASTTSCAAV